MAVLYTGSLDPKVLEASRAKKKVIYDLLGSERHLRSKRDLIEKFVEDHLSRLSKLPWCVATGQNLWA